MSYAGSPLRKLEATRLLDKELSIDLYVQQLERNRLNEEINALNDSRRRLIEKEINNARKEYEERLKIDKDIAAEHLARQKRSEEERKKLTIADINRERDLLLVENRNYVALEAELSVLADKLERLKARSKASFDSQKNTLLTLENKKRQSLELLEASKSREAALVAQVEDLRLQL